MKINNKFVATFLATFLMFSPLSFAQQFQIEDDQLKSMTEKLEELDRQQLLDRKKEIKTRLQQLEQDDESEDR